MILVDKPQGWTSFDVVNKIRHALKRAFGLKKIKVGHAGTLDPAATGLLIVCIGKMTKQISLYQDQDKTYTGSMYIGATTPTYDQESEIDQKYEVGHITSQMLNECVNRFTGSIMQKPPIYSALKRDGVRLYKLARKNQKIEVPARPVTIQDFVLTEISMPLVKFEVRCSKGTYIRSLAYDMGRCLGSGAYLTSLRRTAIGSFNVQDAWSIEEVMKEIQDLSHEYIR